MPAVGRLLDTSINHGHLPLLGEWSLSRTMDLRYYTNDKLRYLGPRGDTVVIQNLYGHPRGLQARDSVVFLSFDNGLSGTVHAYHPFKRRLLWTFVPQDHFPDIPDAGYSDLALDGQSLLVATDQKIFLLDHRTGRLLWKIALPRQTIRPWGLPWTHFRKYQGRYLVTCYDDLFILDPKTGRLLNHIPGGEHNPPDPVATGNLVCIATRAGHAPATLGSFTSPAPVYDSVLAIARITFHGPAGDSVRIDRIRRKHVPPGTPVLLSFVGTESDRGDFILQQKGIESTETRRFKLPSKVKGERVLYVVLNDWFKGLFLSKGEKSLGSLKYQN